jgi:Spy/CpxP family protein refolding chaperone
MNKIVRAAFIAGVCFVAVAIAAAPRDSCGIKEGPRGEKMARELGLSTQQKAKFKEFREEMRDVRKAHMEKMKALLDKSKEELRKPSPSRDVLYAYARESGELRRVMAEKEADHMLKVKAVLTPEQFNKLLGKDFMLRRGHGPDGPRGDKGPHEHGPHGDSHEKGTDHEMDD